MTASRMSPPQTSLVFVGMSSCCGLQPATLISPSWPLSDEGEDVSPEVAVSSLFLSPPPQAVSDNTPARPTAIAPKPRFRTCIPVAPSQLSRPQFWARLHRKGGAVQPGKGCYRFVVREQATKWIRADVTRTFR